MGGIRMINRRVLSICNYALGIYTLICSLLFIWTLSDVKELIEVHQWHGCSNYKDYPTYVASGSIVLAFCAAAFFGCWLLLIYALYRKDAVFIAGQAFSFFVYARNLYFVMRDKKEAAEAA